MPQATEKSRERAQSVSASKLLTEYDTCESGLGKPGLTLSPALCGLTRLQRGMGEEASGAAAARALRQVSPAGANDFTSLITLMPINCYLKPGVVADCMDKEKIRVLTIRKCQGARINAAKKKKILKIRKNKRINAFGSNIYIYIWFLIHMYL